MRRLGLWVASTVLMLWACGGSSALAAETIYWGNYEDDAIAFADSAGEGGSELNVAGSEVYLPEGMAIDSATGRIYWTNRPGDEIIATGAGESVTAALPPGEGSIGYARLGGGGGGFLNTGTAPIDQPIGLAIDPVARVAYWANAADDSIGFAKLDGGGSGSLNTSGATMAGPGRIAIDVPGGRLYWANGMNATISYAELDGSGGGGDLNLTGASTPEVISGLAIDPTAGRIYWTDAETGGISYAALNDSGGGDLATGTALFDEAFGLALDPLRGRVYWGNYGAGAQRQGAISYALLDGTGGADLNIAVAPVSGPQYPVVLKPPSGTGAPEITGEEKVGSTLSCSRGSWGEDFAGSFVYRAPRSYSYQWGLNGADIEGATESNYTPAAPGNYTCAVTASNHAGSATQSSAVEVSAPSTTLAVQTSSTEVRRGEPVSVVVIVNCCECAKGSRPTRLKLAMDLRKAEARPGGTAVFVASVRNTSGAAVKGFRICTHLGGRAKRELQEPRCVWVPGLAEGQERRLVLRVPVGDEASGAYAVRFIPRGRGMSRPVRAKVVVVEEPEGRPGGKPAPVGSQRRVNG